MVESTRTISAAAGVPLEGGERLEPVISALLRLRRAAFDRPAPEWIGLNLTLPQIHVLQAIRAHGRLSGRGLAAELGVSPAAVVALCDRLEQRGYLERVRDEADRRIWWLGLTPAGAQVLDGFTEPRRARIARALLRLGDDELLALAATLSTLADAVEAEPVEAEAAAEQG